MRKIYKIEKNFIENLKYPVLTIQNVCTGFFINKQ